MMSQVDADIELPEAPAAFGSVTGWTAAPPGPFKPLARPRLGTVDKSQHWPPTMTRWGNLGNNNGRRVSNDVWEKVRKHKKTIHHWCLMVLLTFFFFFHISETHSYPQTYHSSAFGQAHIAMVILVKRLTFGPCWWLLGDTPIAMVMASRRTLTLPWWWWQEPGMPTNGMMDRCHAGGEGETWLECPLVMSTVKETF